MKDNSEGENNEEDMNPIPVAAKIKEHPDIIVGIKNAHYEKPGWIALKRTVEAGNLANKPIMVDDDVFSDSGRTTREKVLEVMRPGDIHTHMYNDHQLELVDRKIGVVQPYMREARRRGVLFDLGHGGGSFIWPVATKAVKQGFLPDTFGTDLHPPSRMSGQVDVPNCISKLMSLGMSLQDGILRATVNPAKAIRHFPELGTLGVGKTADISIFELKTGAFSYTDSARKKLAGTKKLQCVLTVRDGRVVYDREGISFPLWTSAGEYEVLR
jgi:dihydroorotase